MEWSAAQGLEVNETWEESEEWQGMKFFVSKQPMCFVGMKIKSLMVQLVFLLQAPIKFAEKYQKSLEMKEMWENIEEEPGMKFVVEVRLLRKQP